MVNGETVDNVTDVSVYKEYMDMEMTDYKCHFHVSTMEHMGDTKKRMSIYAGEKYQNVAGTKINDLTIVSEPQQQLKEAIGHELKNMVQYLITR